MNEREIMMFNTVTDIRDDIVEQAAEYKFKKSPARFAVPLGIAASVCLIVGGIALAAALSNGSNVPVANPAETAAGGNVPTTVAATVNETGVMYLDPYTGMEKGWDEKPMYFKFGSFTHDGCEYCANVLILAGYADHTDIGGIIASADIGEKLYDVTMSTIETFSGKEFTANAEVYAIKGIYPDAFTAVKYEGFDGYYSFMNRNYAPKDIGELTDDLDLMNNISFGSIYVEQVYLGNSSWNVYDPVPVDSAKADIITKFLEECRSLGYEYEDTHFHEEPEWFSVGVAVEKVGIGAQRYKVIEFRKDGTMTTNIMDYGYCFNVGEERVRQLAEALGVTEQTPRLSTVPAYDLPQTTYDTNDYDIAVAYTGEETTVMYTTSTGREPLPWTIPE